MPREQILRRIANAAAFYRANPHRFVADYLHINLKLLQKILIYMMNVSNFFMFIAARGIGKTFLTAIFCVVRCILYPGTKICIAAGNRGQSIGVLEKIRDELIPESEELRNELEGPPIITSNRAEVRFKNSSVIKVVTASDGSRGNRANILVADEFRMIKADVITTVLRKFLTSPRHPKYLDKPEYSHMLERNKEIYLSSAWFADHWSYQKMIDFFKNMVDDQRKYFVCGLPYQLSIAEGMLSREQVEDEMAEESFNELKWQMEMSTIWQGDEEGSFFEFSAVNKNRHIKKPWLPPWILPSCAESSIRIPQKRPGEIRLLSADIALMASKKVHNDATSIMINSMLPDRSYRYTSNIVYTDVWEGVHTDTQALRIRKLYEYFSCDYIVIDAKGVGSGVLDSLLRDIYDRDEDVTYGALSVCNDQSWQERAVAGANRVIWAINASARFNSDCALFLREGFRSNKIKLLISEFDAEEILAREKWYSQLSPSEQMQVKLPYINTTLAIDEITKLNHDESSGLVKISERSGMRKDRYSSLAYNYWVATQLEARERKRQASTNSDFMFNYRAPIIKKSR